jgi:hypothetical protein
MFDSTTPKPTTSSSSRLRVRRWLHPIAGFFTAISISFVFVSCNKPGPYDSSTNTDTATKPSAGTTVDTILEKNRKLEDSHDSVVKMRAKIQVGNPAAQLTPIPPQVEMTVSTKRSASGQSMLVEFTSPASQRDLDALMSINSSGDVDGTRYNQSGGNFVATKGVLNEDSLFGMTLQEFLGGQPEKYDLKLIGEDTFNQTPVYRLDGKLKPSTESRFDRLVMLVAKDNFATLAAEFYDEHDQLSRRMTVDKQGQIGGHWERLHWTVDNRAKEKKVEFETLDAKYDQNLSDALFTRENLKKIATK